MAGHYPAIPCWGYRKTSNATTPKGPAQEERWTGRSARGPGEIYHKLATYITPHHLLGRCGIGGSYGIEPLSH